MSNWEWVEKACLAKGYIKSAQKAKEIAGILKLLYGDTITEEWREVVGLHNRWRGHGLINNRDIRNVVEHGYYFCIACEKSRGDVGYDKMCDNCKFGNEFGQCIEDGSLLSQFWEAFIKERDWSAK